MAILTFDRIGITGVDACVPKQKIVNTEFTGFFTPKEIKAAIQKTGIAERRVVDDKTCASDLCCAAAEALLEEMSIDRDEIDVLIFVSQTPDYRMPITGTILQDRLGLAKTTAAFDINLGGSGYVYGLALPILLPSRNLSARCCFSTVRHDRKCIHLKTRLRALYSGMGDQRRL